MDYELARKEMVESQIKDRGIKDTRVLEAMFKVPRHLFVSPGDQDIAYGDYPLPVGEGQTISQPYMVAWMTEALRLTGEEKVLEIGTGSGYHGAILAELAKLVYTVERSSNLAEKAKKIYEELEYRNITVVVGNGTEGLPEYAPYDAIVVTAGAPFIPQPLIEQLAEGGRLVIPVGSIHLQMLTLVEKRAGRIVKCEVGSCVFVPLKGKYGWPERSDDS